MSESDDLEANHKMANQNWPLGGALNRIQLVPIWSLFCPFLVLFDYRSLLSPVLANL